MPKPTRYRTPPEQTAGTEPFVYTSTFATANGIKTSVASAVTAQSYSGAALDGALATPGPAVLVPARTLSVTTAANAGSYVIGSKVTFTGKDMAGEDLVEAVAITSADGPETLTTQAAFYQLTKIDVAAQADALGHFTFGAQDLHFDPPAREFRTGAAANVAVQATSGRKSAVPSLAGEHHRVQVQRFLVANMGNVYPLSIYW